MNIHLDKQNTVAVYFCDWWGEHVIAKVQAATSSVWDHPVQLLCSYSSHQEHETNGTECWIVGSTQQQRLGQEGRDREGWRVPAGDKKTEKALL